MHSRRRACAWRHARRAALLLGLALLPAPAAWANKDVQRLQAQVGALQAEVVNLSRQLDEALRELRRLNEGLAEQNATLRRSLQESRAADEAQQTSLREVGERVGALDERMQQMTALARPAVTLDTSAAGADTPPGYAPATSSTPSPAELRAPREMYSQAYADYARGNYDLAMQGFEAYLRTAPGTDLADNAQFWIGECLYGQQRYADAIEAWNTLLRDHPASDKLPDARVKKGMALERLGRRSQALIEYRFVAERYPGSSAARIARERLNPN